MLPEPYDAADGKLIVREMTELLVLDLVRKKKVTKQITLTLCYDRESLVVLQAGRSMRDTIYGVAKTGKPYRGTVNPDYYGRPAPKNAHGTGNLDHYTSSTKQIMNAMMALYDRIVDKNLLVRRMYVVAANVVDEHQADEDSENGFGQMDLFTDYEAMEKEKQEREKRLEKERKIQEAMIGVKKKFGKNAMLKGMKLLEGGTARERNGQIGGHKA